MKVFYGASIVAVMSLTLAAAALVNIWNEGASGAGKASFAVFLSLALLAVPAGSLPSLLRLPKLYEVTTDPANPPAFDRIAKIRQGQANPAHYDAAFGPLQTAAYPDIKPLFVARPLTDVYSAVHETVKALNWKVIDEQSPEAAKNGYIEAIDRTLIFGFTDDVAIRITGSAKTAKSNSFVVPVWPARSWPEREAHPDFPGGGQGAPRRDRPRRADGAADCVARRGGGESDPSTGRAPGGGTARIDARLPQCAMEGRRRLRCNATLTLRAAPPAPWRAMEERFSILK